MYIFIRHYATRRRRRAEGSEEREKYDGFRFVRSNCFSFSSLFACQPQFPLFLYTESYYPLPNSITVVVFVAAAVWRVYFHGSSLVPDIYDPRIIILNKIYNGYTSNTVFWVKKILFCPTLMRTYIHRIHYGGGYILYELLRFDG